MARLLIRSAHVISMDPRVGEVPDGDVLVDGPRIAAVGRDLPAEGAEVIDATGMIALPGLVDAHRHVWQVLARGVAADMSFRGYFAEVLVGMGPRVTPDDLYLAHRAGMLDALHSGVTTTLDWSHIQNSPDHTDEIIRAHRESGARVVFAHGPPLDDPRRWLLDGTDPHPADARRVRGVLDDDHDLVTMALGVRGPEYTPWATAEADLALARDLAVPAVLHVGHPRYRHLEVLAGLRDRRLLGPDLVFGNGFVLDDEEIALVAGAGATLVTSPELGMQTGRGFPPIERLRAAGVPVGIGADMLAGYGGSPFSLMRLTVQTTRLLRSLAAEGDGERDAHAALSDAEILAMATIEGARAVGLGERVGSLTPGKQADIVLLDGSAPNLYPRPNPVGLVVQHADTGNVDTVLVAGRVRKRDGRLIDGDLDEVRDGVVAASARLLAGRPTDRDGRLDGRPAGSRTPDDHDR